MTDDRKHRRTNLFTVRLWIKQVAEGHIEIRGLVQRVLTGDTRYFREWVELTTFFEKILENEKS